ncbi:MAG: DNA internalization-related competence protein ComEC/Rec2, partial [bacterium]
YYLDNFIENNLPPQEAALLQGLMIGNRGEITIELREAFSKLGVIHILAVSGLHVGFIIIIFMGVFGFLRIPYRFLVLLTLIGLIFYAYLTNLKPPVVRASIMGGLILLGTLLERKTDIFNTLALAALIILIFNPLELFQSGFQLSFAAVLSIIYLYPKLKSPLNKFKKIQNIPVVHYAFELLLVSTAAFLGTLPFTIIYFNRLPNFAPFANLLIIPLVFCGLASGMAATACNVIMPVLAKFYLAATWFFLHTVIKFVDWASQLPLAYWETYKFSLFEALAYGTALFLIFHIHHKRARRWLVIYTLALANIFVWQANIEKINTMQIIFFDVGQGDAALLTLPHSQHILIDGGPRGENYDAGEWVIAPYLKREGIRKLDVVILSHADTDHLGGVPYILQTFMVHEVWDNGQVGNTKLSREYLDLIKSLKITRRILRAGEIIEDFKPLHLYVFHPTESFLMRKNLSLNDGSLSLKMSYGEIDFLFNGDIEQAGEQQVSKFGHLLASEVLKISHHGSNTSTSSILLENVRPQLAIISVGAFNKFGHPDQKVLNRLHAVGTKVFRTDRDAAVILKTNGHEIKQVNWK